jgi:hypothetical protein
LAGTEESAYMQASAAALLAAGHPVLRLNLSGAGASRPLCRLQYHAGRTGEGFVASKIEARALRKLRSPRCVHVLEPLTRPE